MLEKDPLLRITAKEALNHSWFALAFKMYEDSLINKKSQRRCISKSFNIEEVKPVSIRLISSFGSDSSKNVCSIPNNFDINEHLKSTLAQEIIYNEKIVTGTIDLQFKSKNKHINEFDDESNFNEDDISERNRLSSKKLDILLNRSLKMAKFGSIKKYMSKCRKGSSFTKSTFSRRQSSKNRTHFETHSMKPSVIHNYEKKLCSFKNSLNKMRVMNSSMQNKSNYWEI